MTPAIPNKLMPWLQAIAAVIILLLFCALALGPMFGLQNADADMKETEKAIVLILVGFLFGSAVSSSKKDDQNAALTSALITPTSPSAPSVDSAASAAPVKIDDSKPVAVRLS